jgi:hypothetical protein
LKLDIYSRDVSAYPKNKIKICTVCGKETFWFYTVDDKIACPICWRKSSTGQSIRKRFLEKLGIPFYPDNEMCLSAVAVVHAQVCFPMKRKILWQ